MFFEHIFRTLAFLTVFTLFTAFYTFQVFGDSQRFFLSISALILSTMKKFLKVTTLF